MTLYDDYKKNLVLKVKELKKKKLKTLLEITQIL